MAIRDVVRGNRKLRGPTRLFGPQALCVDASSFFEATNGVADARYHALPRTPPLHGHLTPAAAFIATPHGPMLESEPCFFSTHSPPLMNLSPNLSPNGEPADGEILENGAQMLTYVNAATSQRAGLQARRAQLLSLKRCPYSLRDTASRRRRAAELKQAREQAGVVRPANGPTASLVFLPVNQSYNTADCDDCYEPAAKLRRSLKGSIACAELPVGFYTAAHPSTADNDSVFDAEQTEAEDRQQETRTSYRRRLRPRRSLLSGTGQPTTTSFSSSLSRQPAEPAVSRRRNWSCSTSNSDTESNSTSSESPSCSPSSSSRAASTVTHDRPPTAPLSTTNVASSFALSSGPFVSSAHKTCTVPPGASMEPAKIKLEPLDYVDSSDDYHSLPAALDHVASAPNCTQLKQEMAISDNQMQLNGAGSGSGTGSGSGSASRPATSSLFTNDRSVFRRTYTDSALLQQAPGADPSAAISMFSAGLGAAVSGPAAASARSSGPAGHTSTPTSAAGRRQAYKIEPAGGQLTSTATATTVTPGSAGSRKRTSRSCQQTTSSTTSSSTATHSPNQTRLPEQRAGPLANTTGSQLPTASAAASMGGLPLLVPNPFLWAHCPPQSQHQPAAGESMGAPPPPPPPFAPLWMLYPPYLPSGPSLLSPSVEEVSRLLMELSQQTAAPATNTRPSNPTEPPSRGREPSRKRDAQPASSSKPKLSRSQQPLNNYASGSGTTSTTGSSSSSNSNNSNNSNNNSSSSSFMGPPNMTLPPFNLLAPPPPPPPSLHTVAAQQMAHAHALAQLAAVAAQHATAPPPPQVLHRAHPPAAGSDSLSRARPPQSIPLPVLMGSHGADGQPAGGNLVAPAVCQQRPSQRSSNGSAGVGPAPRWSPANMATHMSPPLQHSAPTVARGQGLNADHMHGVMQAVMQGNGNPMMAAAAAAAHGHSRQRTTAIAGLPEHYETLMFLAQRFGDKQRGMSRREIEQLELRLWDGQTGATAQSNCVICMCDFELRQKLRVLSCSHQFHSKCVDKWLKTNRTCPICRADATGKTNSSKSSSNEATNLSTSASSSTPTSTSTVGPATAQFHGHLPPHYYL